MAIASQRPRQVLIVDDEEAIRLYLARSFEREGFEVLLADCGHAAQSLFERERPDVMILDVRLPDTDGLELLRLLRKTDPNVPVLIVSAFGEIKMAVEAMRVGAFDFVEKPFDFNTLYRSVENALKIVAMREELTALKSVWERGQYMGLIGQSPVMQDLFRTIERIGTSSSTTVLITGETGTGKEVVARTIHEKSERKNAPFVAINCATLDNPLLESELFGHVRGAFTDAKNNKPGLFEVADGGTIFLDEIAEMDLRIQANLLRVLESKSFRRVGGTRDIKVDVRVIAATNVTLEKRVEEGRFREDLFYRLSVIPLPVPPLRERGKDVLLLAEAFLKHYTHEFSRNILGFSESARDALMAYRWPGNVRELRNVVERMVLLADSDLIRAEDLPVGINLKRPRNYVHSNQPTFLEPFQKAKQKVTRGFEQSYLERLLQLNEGNVTQAADHAQMERSSLQRLMRKHGLNAQAFRKMDSTN